MFGVKANGGRRFSAIAALGEAGARLSAVQRKQSGLS